MSKDPTYDEILAKMSDLVEMARQIRLDHQRIAAEFERLRIQLDRIKWRKRTNFVPPQVSKKAK